MRYHVGQFVWRYIFDGKCKKVIITEYVKEAKARRQNFLDGNQEKHEKI
jgi:hypothetical protein